MIRCLRATKEASYYTKKIDTAFIALSIPEIQRFTPYRTMTGYGGQFRTIKFPCGKETRRQLQEANSFRKRHVRLCPECQKYELSTEVSEFSPNKNGYNGLITSKKGNLIQQSETNIRVLVPGENLHIVAKAKREKAMKHIEVVEMASDGGELK
jgi:hypothetical protein